MKLFIEFIAHITFKSIGCRMNLKFNHWFSNRTLMMSTNEFLEFCWKFHSLISYQINSYQSYYALDLTP